MIVDSSALVAIIKDEPEAVAIAGALASGVNRISAANYVEAGIVADRMAESVIVRRLDEVITQAEIEIVPLTPRQADIARQAYRDFGRGSGHPAKLNFGDCFAYALAIDTGEPLLWKGDDFGHTGVASALPSE